MATAKRVSELQALSFSVSFQGEDLVLYYDPFFRAKTESAANPLPRSVIVPSLSDLLVTCLRESSALSEQLSSLGKLLGQLLIFRQDCSSLPGIWNVPCRRMPCHSTFDSSVDSGAVSTSRPPRAHDIRGIATSLNYYSNLSLSNLMQVATWKSNLVFASRYLKEVSATQDNIRQFGPLVIAGDRLHPRPPQHKH